MVLEWTVTAGVGLMVGVAFGILLELRYVVRMDRKLEKILRRIERLARDNEEDIDTILARVRKKRNSIARKAKKTKKKSKKKKSKKKKTKKKPKKKSKKKKSRKRKK